MACTALTEGPTIPIFAGGYNIACLILNQITYYTHRFGFVTVKSSLIKQKQNNLEMFWKKESEEPLFMN